MSPLPKRKPLRNRSARLLKKRPSFSFSVSSRKPSLIVRESKTSSVAVNKRNLRRTAKRKRRDSSVNVSKKKKSASVTPSSLPLLRPSAARKKKLWNLRDRKKLSRPS